MARGPYRRAAPGGARPGGGNIPPDRGVCRAPRRAAAARANSVVGMERIQDTPTPPADLDLLLAELTEERTAPRLPGPAPEPPTTADEFDAQILAGLVSP